MKYFFDTEFIEDGKTIDLLSIGIVAEDGRELYLESNEADLSKADGWVRANVFTSMLWTPEVQRSKFDIACGVFSFVSGLPLEDVESSVGWPATSRSRTPEFWAYYADYDWVALCQLFGRMIDLPDGWPMYCRDFKQLVGEKKLFKLPENEAHNALADAHWLRDSFEALYRPAGAQQRRADVDAEILKLRKEADEVWKYDKRAAKKLHEEAARLAQQERLGEE